jgi:lipooligosaccharide transport system ATP-binding protein
MSNSVIKVKNVNKTYGSLAAVSDLSFEVEAGTCFGFLGPNGAGKSTMMKMLYGKCSRDKDCDGVIDVFGFDPRNNELAIKYLAGVVPQDNNLDDELDVTTNLYVYSKFYDIAADTAKSRINSLLDFLELSEKSKSRLFELSGGMKRRLVIARALLNNPKLLILDEPTTGLDPQVRHMIWEKINQLKKQGTTILITTHYMEEAFNICDTVLIMNKGKKVMQGCPRTLLEQNIERFVLELHDASLLSKITDENLLSRVRIFANDIETLKAMTDLIAGSRYYLRQANLEDLFLKATGRALGDEQ